jgi:transcriptional regulator with XRE-family HTH domain
VYLGGNLQYLRKANGNMTQEKLAEKLGVSRQTVSRWESSEAYPEIPKLLDLCEIFRCSLDDLLRQDIQKRAAAYLPVRLVRIEQFRMAQYVIISANAKQDVMAYMNHWADKHGLTGRVSTPMLIGWEFPYLSAEQKNRFGLRGFGCGCIVPDDFPEETGGPEFRRQESADYAVITVRDPFAPGSNRISYAYRQIMEYLSTNGIPKSAKAGVLPCFEYEYTRDGTLFLDIFVHCEPTFIPENNIKFL